MTAPARIPLEDLASQILVVGKITSANRHQLMLTLLADGLSEEDCVIIDRLLYGVRKGLLRLD